MSAPESNDDLLDLGCQGGALDPQMVKGYRGRKDLTPAGLAALLVRDGLLTAFQAEQLLAGKWSGFLLGGKYRIMEPLGRGGMASVYLCEELPTRRKVAIKVLPIALAEDPAAVDRFHREARAVGRLNHPNIVRAYAIERDDRLLFLVMEYVDGSSLRELVQKHGPLSPCLATSYIRQAALGLQHSHEAGLVHRDIKPGNLIVDRQGVVKLLDMGLARCFLEDPEGEAHERSAASMMGTADFLAPEQAVDCHNVDIRADIYSLGATFYYLLAGTGPFQEGTIAQKIIWHQCRHPKPIREIRPEVPEGLAAILDKMMAKDKSLRYQTPREVADALQPYQPGARATSA